MNKNQDKYTLVIRGLALCVVSFLWYLSIIWSAAGFSINDPELKYIGIGLALSVTVAQLVFNRGAANPTIFLVGLAAYIYGFATNFIGISAVIGLDFTSTNFSANPFGLIAGGLGAVALSIIVEAAPESFLLWALYPKEQTPGDFVSALAKGIRLPKRNGKPTHPEHSKTVSERSKFVQSFQNVPKRSLPHERDVLVWIEKEYHKRNKNMPPYAEIVKNTPLTSTSKVKQYVDRFNERLS